MNNASGQSKRGGLRTNPSWFGKRYPSIEDLEAFSEELGAPVIWTAASTGCFWAGDEEHAPALFIPSRFDGFERAWTLAHELGHLAHHSGPKTSWTRDPDEIRADRWAACALIPEDRINYYQNASIDSFIAAISSNYGDIPYNDCPARRLAAHVASVRLRCLKEGI